VVAKDSNATVLLPAGESEPIRGRRRQSVAESLLADIFRGELKAGERLVTQRLAERYHVSHTPIREALISLAAIGVIDLQPNRGAVVRRLSTRDVREVCGVRRALECEAVSRACGLVNPSQLERLAREFRKLIEGNQTGSAVINRALVLDSELHDLVATSCGNRFLAAEINRLKTLFRAYRDQSYLAVASRDDFSRIPEESREHLEIVEALLAKDRKRATKAMSFHIRQGVRYWSRALPEEEI
jgi:DNA-binding GntR family transcriptional regulator